MNIVLMHGVLGFDRIGGIDYFNGVAAHLGATFSRAKVLTTAVNPLGTVEERATEAARQIAGDPGAKALESGKPLHLIAHSMGGLDARFLVSHDLEGLKERVRTVVCVGTPHFGSPVASLIDKVNPFEHFTFARRDSSIFDELRADNNAVHDLSEKAAVAFNANCLDVPTVHYFDVAGIGRDALFPTSAPFLPLHLLVSAVSGRNDGVVPFTSATRQRPPAAVWHADHADLVGHDLNGGARSTPPFDYLSAYALLVRNTILKNQ
jgi:triacylglycerol lipase